MFFNKLFIDNWGKGVEMENNFQLQSTLKYVSLIGKSKPLEFE